MAKKATRGGGGGGDSDVFDRVFAAIDDATPGLHDLERPTPELPSGLPGPLIELYARCDGGRLFHDEIELVPAAGVTIERERWQFATVHGDAVAIDDRGRIWRADDSLDDDVCDGTRLDRWLYGMIDALGLIYDADGEFVEDAFDDDGELIPELEARQLRAQLKRDANAPGPRWRLAASLLAADDVAGARAELEQVVAIDPTLAWAWLDLARISERLHDTAPPTGGAAGQGGAPAVDALSGALDEARAAADAATAAHHAQAGYFWAQVARLARRADNEPARAEAAARVVALAPELRAAQLAGARESLAGGDPDSAHGLLELLRAVWPRDLEVLALARQLESTTAN